jgi:hypothetical protein
MTIVWGVAYVAEAAARVIIVENTSPGTALTISKVMPFAVAGVLVAWMTAYGQHARRKGERAVRLHPAGATPTSPASAEGEWIDGRP